MPTPNPISAIPMQSTIKLQSCCNHKIPMQWKNAWAGDYRTREASRAQLFSHCAIRTPKGFDRSAIPGNISHSVSRQKEESSIYHPPLHLPSTTISQHNLPNHNAIQNLGAFLLHSRQTRRPGNLDQSLKNEHIPTLPRPRQINDAIIAILAQSKIMAQS